MMQTLVARNTHTQTCASVGHSQLLSHQCYHHFQSGKYSHPNIVRLVDICHGERNPGDREMVLYLVFEHMDQVSWMETCRCTCIRVSVSVYLFQDLAVYLERCPGPGLAPDRIKDLMWQLLCGIDFLHRCSRPHKNFLK